MDARAVPLLAIFEKNMRLEVPLFQRQYVWSKEHQWEPLWEDIERKFVEQLNGRKDAPVHFLGAMVLDQQQTPILGRSSEAFAEAAPQGWTQGTRPASSSVMILLVISSYRLARSELARALSVFRDIADLRDGRRRPLLQPSTRHGWLNKALPLRRSACPSCRELTDRWRLIGRR